MNNLVRAAFESAIRAIEFDDTKEAKEALILCGRCVLYKKDRSGKRHIQTNERWSLFSRYWCIFP